MILNMKEQTIDGLKISKDLTLLLALLSNNYWTNNEEIARYVYGYDKHEYNQDSYLINRRINNCVLGLRKKGLHIDSITSWGKRLIETIYIDY